ncbi:hypothetical protein COV58_03825 [Candidatus Roizmanbacteria bacterium CG11_big_fil_rev_8_21_14_0_20_36_8]|uniref:Polymerase beta nucleotidyltransferase domain-containing protein n=2 Tax=Candidatus Roizmaniibacteriota TaxID=1752723 RepID=A0A2M6ITD4_9BACT|nr:MAG: hypothetical protein COV58_03825 [Candidatus Roizmanbacteria bacterium CG11_big_fil_rev_8_21_14_0_20_36_8]PIZ65956.1 MAG: hypothetical protein COY14_01255 [Candidatus Roizmanbacteria bacterium CG_4_10_14_0_2_um_filter_36_9]
MKDIQETIKPILIKYGVKKASIFGSYANSTFDSNSDVDILFEPPKKMGISYIELKHELEDTLKKKVDLLSFNGINKYLKKSILDSQRPIL